MTAPRLVALAALCAALVAPGVRPALAATAEHEVRAGDNLHLIAGYYFKDPRRWREVWRSNRARLRNASLLRPGTLLRIDLDDGAAWGEIPYEEFVARVRGPR